MKQNFVAITLWGISYGAIGVSIPPPPLEATLICSHNTVVRAEVTGISIGSDASRCSFSKTNTCNTITYRIKVVDVIKANNSPVHSVTSISEVLAERDIRVPTMTPAQKARKIGREYIVFGDLMNLAGRKRRPFAGVVPVDWYDESVIDEFRTRCANSN